MSPKPRYRFPYAVRRAAAMVAIVAASMGLHTALEDILDGHYWRGICMSVTFVALLVAAFQVFPDRKARKRVKK